MLEVRGKLSDIQLVSFARGSMHWEGGDLGAVFQVYEEHQLHNLSQIRLIKWWLCICWYRSEPRNIWALTFSVMGLGMRI